MTKQLFFTIRLSGLPLFLFAVLQASSQEWTSVQDGNWNSPSTWGTSNYPPATLKAGMTVNILHSVSLNSSFASTLSVNNGASLNIDGGIFLVQSGISMDNRGRFTGINGSLLQCLYVGCYESGSQASGVWNTLDGGYTRMENMTIQIAQDWATTNSGRRYHKNCCVKTGQNFSINNQYNRDTLINTRFEIGLHGSGNFQQNNGKVIYDNIDIDIAGSGGGNVQFSGGTFSGTIRAIRIQNINGNIQTSSSVKGNISVDYYCLQKPSNYQDPSNKILNETLDCEAVNTLLSEACFAGNSEPSEVAERSINGGTIVDKPVRNIPNLNASVYPNPFSQRIETNFRLNRHAIVTVTLTDIAGRQVYRATAQGIEGVNRITVKNLTGTVRGLYILQVRTEDALIAHSLLIKN